VLRRYAEAERALGRAIALAAGHPEYMPSGRILSDAGRKRSPD